MPINIQVQPWLDYNSEHRFNFLLSVEKNVHLSVNSSMFAINFMLLGWVTTGIMKCSEETVLYIRVILYLNFVEQLVPAAYKLSHLSVRCFYILFYVIRRILNYFENRHEIRPATFENLQRIKIKHSVCRRVKCTWSLLFIDPELLEGELANEGTFRCCNCDTDFNWASGLEQRNAFDVY